MEPKASSRTVKGTAYPLNSKRLKLQHIQHLARALTLPAAAPRSDLEVISGKIRKIRGEGVQAEVVLSLSEEGEQLSLRDQDGTFLVVPVISAWNLLQARSLATVRETQEVFLKSWHSFTPFLH